MTNHAAKPIDALGDRLMAIFWRRPAESLAERTRRRVTLHLVPYLFFLYILAYLDRANLSVAQLGMKAPIDQGGMGFDRDVTGFGFGIFFWGYWILEIPSTISVVRWGARWVFVRILVLWGICTILVGTIGLPLAYSLGAWLPWQNTPEHQFYFFRFMLGFFEGGFFPSVIVYLSLWFRSQDRAKAIAGFMAAIPMANVVGNPVSGLLLEVNWFGIEGWRWIFILEGILPIIAGFITLFFLPSRPADAKWLTAEERDWLVAELDCEQKGKEGHGHLAWVHHLGMVLLLTLVYFCLNLTSYGLVTFMPEIIEVQSGLSKRAASIVAALPFVMAFLAMQVNGRHSDRTGERIWHVAIPLSLLSVAISLAAVFDSWGWLAVGLMIFCVGTFMYAHLPAFWPIPTMFLGATAAASAIGFINMIGNLGGSAGSMMAGQISTGQAGFGRALFFLAPWPFLSALVILIVGYVRRKAPGKEPPPLPVPERPTVKDANPEAATS